MHKSIYFLPICLTIFGDGAGDGGTAAGGTTGATATVAASQSTKGVKSNPLADVVYGKQVDEPDAEATETTKQTSNSNDSALASDDRANKFDALIKGEYKDLYDAKVQSIVQSRLKNSKEITDKYEQLKPIVETLTRKYGVKGDDIGALAKALDEDDSFYEQEALEKGLTVDQLKEVRRIERENADLKAQMQEQSRRDNANRLYQAWMEQSDSLKQIYPTFDLRKEIANPDFARLLQNNVDVKTAYEVIHKDEIIPAAMQFTANKVKSAVANSIAAGGNRPKEYGGNSSGAVVKSDVSQLTKADRDEIARRVARGERIVF